MLRRFRQKNPVIGSEQVRPTRRGDSARASRVDPEDTTCRQDEDNPSAAPWPQQRLATTTSPSWISRTEMSSATSWVMKVFSPLGQVPVETTVGTY
jgi:hypothetical protein